MFKKFWNLTKKRIPCFMLVYQNYEIICRSIEAMMNFRDQIELFIIENPSDESIRIRERLDYYMRMGLVSKCFLFDENISNNAFEVILRKELNYSKYEYVLVTDGDLLPMDDDWVNEERQILRKNPEVFCIGGDLDMGNLPLNTFPDANDWMPLSKADHGDYMEAFTGAYFLMFRSSQLQSLIEYLKKHNLRFRDGVIASYCNEQVGLRWGRTKKSRFIHLTWDLYRDTNHPYTKFKREIPFSTHWNHDRYAGYTVRHFRCGCFKDCHQSLV
ncbi:MAG TPA: glycosyltransferase family A protein [Chitinophagales bacterium]|nr:glycosyltransferase family 2 protein [Bacteroidota bacterium]HNA58407.1 glycosyltransferase family A protein [Chitinophagales bacterium]